LFPKAQNSEALAIGMITFSIFIFVLPLKTSRKKRTEQLKIISITPVEKGLTLLPKLANSDFHSTFVAQFTEKQRQS
jgi:hypothetical protein